ncbi:MAG: HD family phosphohydrolase [Armatimonadota bacterium]
MTRKKTRSPHKAATRLGRLLPFTHISADWHRLTIAFISITALSSLFLWNLVPEAVPLQIGDVSNREVRAPRSVTYLDVAATEASRRAMMASVEPITQYIPEAMEDSLAEFDGLVKELQSPENREIEPIATNFGIKTDVLRQLISGTNIRWGIYVPVLRSSLVAQMRLPIDDVDSVPVTTIIKTLHNSPLAKLNRNELRLAPYIIKSCLKSNIRIDIKATDDAKKRISQGVSPVFRSLVAGQVLIKPGQGVTKEQTDQLQALGLQYPKTNVWQWVAIVLLITVFIAITAFHLAQYHPHIYNDIKQLWLIVVIIFISTLGIKLGSNLIGYQIAGNSYGYLVVMSTCLAGMLIAVLVSPHLATLLVGIMSVQSAFLAHGDLRFTAISLVSALVGIYSVRNLHDRFDLVRATLWIAASGITLSVITSVSANGIFDYTLVDLIWGITMAIFAVMAFSLLVTVLERPFRVVTPLRLIELCNPETPLLKRLMLEAPGTYAHSVAIANLAAAAAKEIGANPLLARVGAYYHDIGKVKRPEFYVENQRLENVHERLTPSLSALIIGSHVTEGVNLAELSKLPHVVIDIIRQHHGTSLISFFYKQALTNGNCQDNNLEQQFRYGGPRPRSKEAALVMLADSVEAASRCLTKPTPASVENLVKRIIENKVDDGQLDHCQLTFADISLISKCFTHIVCSIYHARIEYPSNNGDTNASHDRQSEEKTNPEMLAL